MAGPLAGQAYMMTADDHVRRLVREACRCAGCDAHVMVCWGVLRECIRHGDDEYDFTLSGPYPSAWEGILGWLDTVHAPLHAERAAEEERRKLLDGWPLRVVDPLLGG
jgi:hypothetical protein